MKYPRLKHDERQNTKLTLADIDRVREMYPLSSSRKLGKIFNVNQTTILYWVNDLIKKKRNKDSVMRYQAKLKDPVKRKKIIEYNRKHNREMYHRKPLMKQYARESARDMRRRKKNDQSV